MKVAVISDVHGNLPALESVLAAIEQEDATEQFATLFLATALPELGDSKGDSKLVASCNNVTAEFQKFERHRVAGGAANKATGGTTSPRFRLGDGE